MIEGQKIIAFTPCGRKRYMDVLAGYVFREHERGHIDEWILFNNPYLKEDSTLAAQFAEHFPWVKVLHDTSEGGGEDELHSHHARDGNDHIAQFYRLMTEGEGAIYVRLDDDIVYIDGDAIPRLIEYRLANSAPLLVFPTIINNVRTSYHMQQQSVLPNLGITNAMDDKIAFRNAKFVLGLHEKALAAIKEGNLVETFSLRSETFRSLDDGHLSINCFAMFGSDMVAANIAHPEETYLALWLPAKLKRKNARCGDAVVIHYAFHTQTKFMDSTDVLLRYAKLSPSFGFQTEAAFMDPAELPHRYAHIDERLSQ